MGLFDFLKKKGGGQGATPPPSMRPADTLSGWWPAYGQFGTDVYASDVVQQAVQCIVREMKKLKPRHVRTAGTDVAPVDGPVQSVLDAPNPMMTTADLIEKVTWLLMLNYNAFVVPQWTAAGTLEALYPIQPSSVTFLQDAGGRMFVSFTFPSGYECTLRYDDVVHIRYSYSVNELMGGNQAGQPDNQALLKTLELNEALLSGVAKALKSSYAVNGVVKYNTLLDDGKMDQALKDLSDRLARSEDGFLAMDLKGEFIPLKREAKAVDADTLKFVDGKILRYFGVPLCILEGDFTKEQYEAFYQKTLEPLIISYNQAFTRTLFSRREAYGYGNRVLFYSEDLVFMTMQQKLELVRLLGDSGTLYENEKREIFGLRPLPELAGVRKQSLNYVDTSIAEQYQLTAAVNGKKVTINVDEDESEEDGENDEEA